MKPSLLCYRMAWFNKSSWLDRVFANGVYWGLLGR